MAHVALRALPKPPPANGCAAQPAIELAPSMKLTVPVGTLPLTVAVNVTVWPTLDGLSELATVVVVGTGPLGALTTCDSVALVEVWLPASPP